MNTGQYEEMEDHIKSIQNEVDLTSLRVFVFGHCHASMELIDLLISYGVHTSAILDNNDAKQGLEYKGIAVIRPEKIIEICSNDASIVLITSRFYESMQRQLRGLGYNGPIRKVIDYNTYAEYSLSKESMHRMKERVAHGFDLLDKLSNRYDGCFKVFCPFDALGDVYFMMSYWSCYAKKRDIGVAIFCVPSEATACVIHMFGDYKVEVYEQRELDSMIQAVIYSRDESSFIAHQDRPYVVDLQKALYIKRIPLEQIYCCGVFGLPVGTKPIKPRENQFVFPEIDRISKGKGVVFSPYAKSVPMIDLEVWNGAVDYYLKEGYICYTNVVGDERPLDGTIGISPSLLEIQSVIECAGTFIGIRSGLCDILREADAKKIALYPDYNYCDTKWKAIEMYYLEQFDYNLLATEVIKWAEL